MPETNINTIILLIEAFCFQERGKDEIMVHVAKETGYGLGTIELDIILDGLEEKYSSDYLYGITFHHSHYRAGFRAREAKDILSVKN